MHLARYNVNGRVSHGIVEGDQIAEIAGDVFGSLDRTGNMVALADVQLLAPTAPTKIVNLAGNYLSHMGDAPPFERPQPFLAPPSSVLEPGGTIAWLKGCTDLHYEGEMAVIIGKRCRRVSKAEAKDYVLGVCAANDISERKWQNGETNGEPDSQWWRGKGADTYSPFGPWVTTGLDYSNLNLITRVNGDEVQRTNTSELIFDVDTLVSFISASMTLEPGDAIFTGTSGDTDPMKSGDVTEVELEGCGILSNPIGYPE